MITDIDGVEIKVGSRLTGFYRDEVVVKKLGRKEHMSDWVLVEWATTGKRKWVRTRWYRVTK